MAVTEVLVCVGSGGVGKTTLAAALGVARARNGKKVLLLTIDPSQRLAQTLGIEGKKEIVKVPDFKGELYAGVIDHKSTFDEFVKRAAGKGAAVDKLYNNKLYQQLSTSLSGSQEFTSLEKLYESYSSGIYDLIILDTPPTQHVLAFLEAPHKLASLFNEQIVKWFKQSGRAGFFGAIVSVGTRQVFKGLELLTGQGFISELAGFFNAVELWQSSLHQRTLAVHKMLQSSSTQFVVVTAFESAKLSEANYLMQAIQKGGFNLAEVFINRAFPRWLQFDETPDADPYREYYQRLKQYHLKRLSMYRDFAAKHEKHTIKLLPEINGEISNLDELSDFVNEVFKK